MIADADPLSTIRVAGTSDRNAIITMLGRAFADDPAMSFIFPERAVRLKKLPRLFRLLFDEDASGLRLVTAGGEAATLWRGPGRSRTPKIDMLLHTVPMLATFGAALGRALTVSNAIEAHFPSGDYWYLHIAGCDPSVQGRGLGAAAVRSGLERVAGSGLPAYLETATERNLGFYRGLGFEVTGEWTVPRGGPRFWSMMRACQVDSGQSSPVVTPDSWGNGAAPASETRRFRSCLRPAVPADTASVPYSLSARGTAR